jgi:hypothetical protein
MSIQSDFLSTWSLWSARSVQDHKRCGMTFPRKRQTSPDMPVAATVRSDLFSVGTWGRRRANLLQSIPSVVILRMLAELKVALAVIVTIAIAVTLISGWYIFVVPLFPWLAPLPLLLVGPVLSGVACDRVARIAMPPGRTLGDVARFFLFIVTVAATSFLMALVLVNTIGS